MIGTVAQGVAHQVPDGHRSVFQPARLEANAIGALDAQLQGVLDGDYALVVGQQFDERIEKGCLSWPRASRDQDIAARAQHPLGLAQHFLGQSALANQVRRRERRRLGGVDI